MRAAVVVLADLGRSTRMQNHARALAAMGGDVDLIGLDGDPLQAAVEADRRVHAHRLPATTTGGAQRFVWWARLLSVPQAIRLFARLMSIPRPHLVLVQTPPARPALAAAWLAARLRGARFVIDWHNLAHALVAVRLGDRHRAVRAMARSERAWSRRADAHLVTSQGLSTWLGRHFGLASTIVFDWPTSAFTRPLHDASAALRAVLGAELRLDLTGVPLVVGPTGWSPGENVDLLLEAVERADRRIVARDADRPQVCVLLTGRGPLRAEFERRVSRRTLRHIAVRTVWVEPHDYPTLVGMADLGLCLHQSSSGLDIPARLADFRGAGVPVAAFDYAPVLGEALVDGEQGVVFRDPAALAEILVGEATSTPSAALVRSRAWLAAHPAERWEDQWPAAAAIALRWGPAARS